MGQQRQVPWAFVVFAFLICGVMILANLRKDHDTPPPTEAATNDAPSAAPAVSPPPAPVKNASQKAADAKALIAQERADMERFTGQGPIKILVASAWTIRELGGKVAPGGSTYVVLGIAAKNDGTETEHVNPNDFTLSTQGGTTVPYDTQTFSLDSPLDAVDLSPGQSCNGVLAFCIPKDAVYTLTRRSMLGGDSVVKKVFIDEPSPASSHRKRRRH